MDDERRLTIGFCLDEAVRVLARKLHRSVPDVESRIKVLELTERYGL